MSSVDYQLSIWILIQSSNYSMRNINVFVVPSLNRIPSAPVAELRSDPAKSTKFKLDTFTAPSFLFLLSITNRKMV